MKQKTSQPSECINLCGQREIGTQSETGAGVCAPVRDRACARMCGRECGESVRV